MSFLTNESHFSGRFHSFFAYSIAITSFLHSTYTPSPSLLLPLLPLLPLNTHSCYTESSLSIGRALWVLHFARRLVEVVYVHEYNRGASLAQIFFASASYAFYGQVVGESLRTRAYPLGRCEEKEMQLFDWGLWFGLCVFVMGEMGNGFSHLQLRWAQEGRGKREKTSWGKPQGRMIMGGGLFEYVTCAHFAYEIVTWAGFAIVTRGAGGAKLVLTWSVGGLALMAYTRHRAYLKYFDGSDPVEKPRYPKSKKALIPWVF